MAAEAIKDDLRCHHTGHHADGSQHPFAVLVDLEALNLHPGDQEGDQDQDGEGTGGGLRLDISTVTHDE